MSVSNKPSVACVMYSNQSIFTFFGGLSTVAKWLVSNSLPGFFCLVLGSSPGITKDPTYREAHARKLPEAQSLQVEVVWSAVPSSVSSLDCDLNLRNPCN
ncbi:hypothetical protein TNCV_3256611 [Trichonephila clavipes]|nr:hypothetical protein TNCV_3256611 [Trichonephila clavipes]